MKRNSTKTFEENLRNRLNTEELPFEENAWQLMEQKLDKDEELGISLIQVGKDTKATKYLKALDDQLQSAGAKFDIVDTITIDDMANLPLAEVLLNAIID